MATYYGQNPPWFGGAQNVLSRQEDERLIKNDILQLLMTVPGERVMRPNFGVNLRNFVFDPLTSPELSALRSEIVQKITAQEPRVIVNSVDLIRDDDKNMLSIKIIVTMRDDPMKQLTIEQFIDLVTESNVNRSGV